MAGKKRSLEEDTSTPSAKKKRQIGNKTTVKENQLPAAPIPEEVDFPRGGGTTFTPLEVKAIRAEAAQEADDELFEDAQSEVRASKSAKKRKKSSSGANDATNAPKSDRNRIEHLNYKKISVGMGILGQIVSVQPLALIVSLPNQLFGHVPITQITSQLTNILESLDDDEEESDLREVEDELNSKPRMPELSEMLRPGQYVRAIVTAVHASGTTGFDGLGKARDEISKASRRVELSLSPDKVNRGLQSADLQPGFTLTAAVQSVEDHGYILDIGLDGVSGFLPFKDMKTGSSKKPEAGWLLNVSVTKLSGNGRIANVSVDDATFSSSLLSEVTSLTSILPGTLVQSLITAVQPTGLNLQALGFFEGTIDQFHLRSEATEKTYKVGKKVKARILYDISGTPPKFALSMKEHVVALGEARIKIDDKHRGDSIQTAYPVGRTIPSVKVVSAEPERGLIVEVEPKLLGFVHISQVSDDHVASLSSSSGHWKVGSTHKARVTGHYAIDGLLQLSLRPSILEQKFLQIGDVQVGEVIKGIIKSLNDSGLFVSLSGNLDGVVWPNHYADITLKHPSKRFKVGAPIKCRVLVVNPERKRISLTAKKSLLESTLPILSKIEDAKPGVIAHAVVFKVFEKHLLVEFYNNLKAIIHSREASEAAVGHLSDSFPIGRVVKVRIVSVDSESSRIVASIRQASAQSEPAFADISAVEIGAAVEGVVSDIHKDNAVMTLQPTQIRALMSLKHLAAHRKVTVPQLRLSLKLGDKLEGLTVVSRNMEQGFVIVATNPPNKTPQPGKGSLTMDNIVVGQIVGGRVTRHTRQGAYVKLSSHVHGMLHPTDTSDDFDMGTPFPAIDSILKAMVIDIDKSKRQVLLSTRHSRIYPNQHKVVIDREIKSFSDLVEGEYVRGFIKSVAEHGLFVMLGRDIDARVQIKELFDQFVKDWKTHFTANQLVKGRISSVDLENKKIEMSFRSENLPRNQKTSLRLTDLKEGQKLDGKVKKIEEYGIFIEMDGSKLSGLCHKSELSDNREADVSAALQSFHQGDRVKVIILAVDTQRRRISLGLKPSYFQDEDFEVEKLQGKAEDEDLPSQRLGVIEDEDAMIIDDGGPQLSDADEERVGEEEEEQESQDEEEDDEMQIALEAETPPQNSLPPATQSTVAAPLKLSGFQWFGQPGVDIPNSDEDEDEDEDEVDVQVGAAKKKKKRKQVEQDLTADMHTKTPESNADFDRLLLGSPNSSFLWVQYMSFQLQLSEIEKAREIGRRGLRTINFREEHEKLNVWIALLNLENSYGTDETLLETFKDAARHNDSKTIHLRMAFIFEQAEKYEKAEEQYKKTGKKFGQSSKVWTLFAEYYLRRGDFDQARALLPRSLQSLDRRKHLKTICKFAQLEYKLGEPERGKTIFEGIMDSHPKRWDLWSIYMDMEAGQSNIQSLRNLFERVLAIKMTSHKAKSFFKKWLELERRLGDEEGATLVKQKAVEWTQRASISS